jgi:hypothetical protein
VNNGPPEAPEALFACSFDAKTDTPVSAVTKDSACAEKPTKSERRRIIDSSYRKNLRKRSYTLLLGKNGPSNSIITLR